MLLKKSGLLHNDQLIFIELYDTGLLKYYLKQQKDIPALGEI